MEMSITQALTEIKTLDARITSGIGQLKLTDMLVNDKLSGQQDKTIVGDSIKANLKSIQDLIARRQAIKSAINLANSTTAVTIGGQSMMIAEALDYKKIIEHKSALLKRAMTDLANTKRTVELQEARNQDAAQKMGEKENVDKDYVEAYLKQFKPTVFDPAHAEALIENLYKEVTDFANEVDFKLSEVNSLTKITV